MRSVLLLIFGVFCCSTSVLLIKASHLHPAVLSSYRLLGAALLLSPLYFANLRKYRGQYSVRHLRLTFLPAVTLALHFISWAQGAQLTRVANASLIVNMVPVVVPFLLFLTTREKITAQEVGGTLLSLLGGAWLASADIALNRQTWLGDLTCFGSMVLFSFYLVQGRINREIPSIWLYVVPLYAMAGAMCFVVALFIADPLAPHPIQGYLATLGLALIPTIMGHSILNYSMQKLSGQIVSVCNLFQFLFAGILAYILFHEAPNPTFYGAGLLVVGGALLVIRGVASTKQGEAELEAATVEGQTA